MDLHLMPRLVIPDRKSWEQHYPNGLGPCVYSSPAFQRLVAQELGPPWESRFLQAVASHGQTLSIPVFIKRGRWGRVEITVRPIAGCVPPMETGMVDTAALQAVLAAAQTPMTAGFTWWLPPGFPWTGRRTAGGGWLGRLDVTFNDVYLITLDSSIKDHYARYCHHGQQSRIRSTYRRGLEIIDRPSEEQINEYYRLYLRVWEEEGWSGYQYPYVLVRGAATELGEAGRLYLMTLHGQLVGGGALLFDNRTVTYFHGVMDRRFKEVYPHYVLYDLAFQQAEARGLRTIDLGAVGPENAGLRFFKQSWGAVPTPAPALRWRFDGPALARRLLRGAAHMVRRVQEKRHMTCQGVLREV